MLSSVLYHIQRCSSLLSNQWQHLFLYIYCNLQLEYTVYYINFKFTFTGVNNDGVGCYLRFWSRICDSNIGSRSHHTISKNKESPGKAWQMAKPTNGIILEQTRKTDKISLGLASAMTSPKSVVPGLQSTEQHSTDTGKGQDRNESLRSDRGTILAGEYPRQVLVWWSAYGLQKCFCFQKHILEEILSSDMRNKKQNIR